VDCGLMENGHYKCPCKSNKVECDPDICGCDVVKVKHIGDTNGCSNCSILTMCLPRLLLGKSFICEGVGVFAG
jgi:hypothetical protein